jgi:hypothetical protein
MLVATMSEEFIAAPAGSLETTPGSVVGGAIDNYVSADWNDPRRPGLANGGVARYARS